jgi:hypothetical protein
VAKVIVFNRDKRRKYHHFLVTVTYLDSQRFGRVYTNSEEAEAFVARQRKSPAVMTVTIQRLN